MYVLTAGARVRFISYLNPDLVLGATGSDWGKSPNMAVLRNLSTTNNSTTEWIIEAGVEGMFKIKWVQEGTYLKFLGNRNNMFLGSDLSLSRTAAGDFDKSGMFRADPVKDGNWFALNRYDGNQVMDVRQSETASGTFVIGFPWNGGDNQIWRTEEVK